MISFTHRSTETEQMDDLTCNGQVVDQSLRELNTINLLLGGNNITLDGVKQLLKGRDKTKLLVADIGCGSGAMAARIVRWARAHGYDLSAVGIDANPNIIRFAQQNSGNTDGVSFEQMDVLSEQYATRKFDIVVATLFTHHFTDAQLAALFRTMKSQTRLGFVINDIHRHFFAYHAIRILTQLFSRSVMVRFDAPLSVRRAFKRNELEEILSKAGIDNYSIKWKWAFRWQVIVSHP